MKLLWVLLIPALAFGQITKRAAPSLAPSDSVGMLTRPDTSWVATHDWVDSQGFATGDTTGMLTRTDTTWLLHDYLNDYATVEHDHSGVYLVPSDTNTVMKRPDTSWVATQFWVNDQGFGTGSGGIEGVTAGVGLSGGGISGTVTVNRDTTLAWDVTRTTLNTLLAGKQDAGTYLVPSDTNTVLKRADTSWVMTHDYIGDFATAEHNHTGVYLAVGDSAGRMMRADTSWILHEYLDDYSAVEHNHSGVYQPAGTYLVPSDSTTLRTYSNSLYLKNADSTSIRNYSTSLYFPFLGGTVASITSNGVVNANYLEVQGQSYFKASLWMINKAADDWLQFGARNTAGAEAALDLNYIGDLTMSGALTVGGSTVLTATDSTSLRNYSGALYEAKATGRTLFSSGLVDSIKTSDTLMVGLIYPAATVSGLYYSASRSCFYKVRLEMVDSLYQTAGVTLVDTTTCIYQKCTRGAAVAGGTFSLTVGKILRAVFESVGTMPKQFNVSVVGTH